MIPPLGKSHQGPCFQKDPDAQGLSASILVQKDLLRCIAIQALHIHCGCRKTIPLARERRFKNARSLPFMLKTSTIPPTLHSTPGNSQMTSELEELLALALRAAAQGVQESEQQVW